MNHKITAAVLSGGVLLCACVGYVPQISAPAVLTADAAGTQELQIPVTLQKFDSPEDKSMGNASLVQMGKIVVDEKGDAVLQLSFQSMVYLGQQGYLGYLQKVNDDGSLTDATVLEEFEGVYDTFNTEGDTHDENLKSQWYPKTVSIPIDAEYDANGNVIGVKNNRIKVQVYVPVMESITSGSGQQFAYLDIKDALFTGSSVTLDGSVKLNTYFNLSDAFLSESDAKVVVSTGDGRSDTFSVGELQKDADSSQYSVTTKVPVKDMTTGLTAQLIDADGTVVDTFSTDVKTYAQSVIKSDAASESQKTLAAELLNYGSRAQVYFQYNYNNNDKNLANSSVPAKRKNTYTGLDTALLQPYTYEATGTLNGMSYQGTALSFLSDLTMRHYFALESGSISDHRFVVNGTAVTPQYDVAQDLYYVDITDISAKNYDADYTVQIDGTYVLNYCALDYCNAAQTASNAKSSLKNLTKALYMFWQAAENV